VQGWAVVVEARPIRPARSSWENGVLTDDKRAACVSRIRAGWRLEVGSNLGLEMLLGQESD
jgi:hypothetical protein